MPATVDLSVDLQSHWAKTNIRKRVWKAKVRFGLTTMTFEEYLQRCGETEFEVEFNPTN